MVTIKIEIGFGKDQENGKKECNIRKAAWIAALADSAIWLVLGAFSLALFYGTAGYAYALSSIMVIFITYLFYLIIKTRFLTKKYGRNVYRDEFGNTGVFLVAISVIWILFQCIFLI